MTDPKSMKSSVNALRLGPGRAARINTKVTEKTTNLESKNDNQSEKSKLSSVKVQETRNCANQIENDQDNSEWKVDISKLEGSCAPWKSFMQGIVNDGMKNFIALYDRQLRHRVAALKLGMSDRAAGDLSSVLQVHSAQTSALLSSALRLQDALAELDSAATSMLEDLQKLYPGSSAIEPARGMRSVRRFMSVSSTASGSAMSRIIDALQVHCDRTIPAVQLTLQQLEQDQEKYLADNFDFDDEELLLDLQHTSKAGKFREKLSGAQQQSGFLWDSLRVKLQRLIADMRDDMIKEWQASMSELQTKPCKLV